MIMLDQLKEVIEEIEIKNAWEYNFVQSLLIQKELHPDEKLSGKQFNILVKIHEKYCG